MVADNNNNDVEDSKLGVLYKDGDVVFRQCDSGDCMYVIISGKVEVIQDVGYEEVEP